jgi:hypothetical protein
MNGFEAIAARQVAGMLSEAVGGSWPESTALSK